MYFLKSRIVKGVLSPVKPFCSSDSLFGRILFDERVVLMMKVVMDIMVLFY